MHMQGLKQMVQTRGGPQNLSGVFRRVVTWYSTVQFCHASSNTHKIRSDFCFSNVWNIQPSFPRLPSTPPTSPIPTPISLDTEADQLKSSHLFGTSSPIIPIISNLRTLTHLLPPSQVASLSTSARMHASNLIYDTEYSLLSINPPSPSLPSLSVALSKCAYTFESVPIRTTLLLYLYLSIRLVPSSSELVQAMVLRLRDSLEQIGIMDWWESDEDRRVWLLWILWMGVVAVRGEERLWFLSELGRLCAVMEVWDGETLRGSLKKVVWEEEWCGGRVDEIWDDIMSWRTNM
jgi:hypothetical protein